MTAGAAALASARDALGRRSWVEARDAFSLALEHEVDPEALEGLAEACWWLDDGDAAIDARTRAYSLYTRRGDRRGAARVALALAGDLAAFRGQVVVAEGCLRRAGRLLDGLGPCPEQAWLRLREAEMAMFAHHDPAAARDLLEEATGLARRVGQPDIEVVALALLGLALVSAGEVREGVALLDEAGAAITTGELSRLEWVGPTYCCFIYAFEDVRDFDRARQWCARLLEFCTRAGVRSGEALCRAHDAGVTASLGSWADAGPALESAARDLGGTRPGKAADALVRLGELRLRQGRVEVAEELFARAEPHPAAARGRAAILLERGEAAEAAALVSALLSAPPAGLGERAACLELSVRAEAALGRSPDAALAELEALAVRAGTPALAAASRLARATVAEASGNAEDAAARFAEALDLSLRAGTPFEAAVARLGLARASAALGRTQALEHARRAASSFTDLGAEGMAREALALRAGLWTAPGPREGDLGLSPREREVVALLAEGLSNRRIAERLVLSEHTVRRHVANILHKLRVPTRAAAVARVAESLPRPRS